LTPGNSHTISFYLPKYWYIKKTEEEQERRAKDLILRETLQRYDALRKKRRQELREQRANATDTTEKVDAPATQYL